MTQMMEKTAIQSRLIQLKLVIFLFFGAQQCLNVYLPTHMEYLGFNRSEIRWITMIAALVSIIGPLLVGFIMDRIAVQKPSVYGKYLRILLFICLIAGSLLFGALLLLPAANQPKSPEEIPPVTFACDLNGAHVYQKHCSAEEPCQDLLGETGGLKLTNCSYTCQSPENFEHLYQPFPNRSLSSAQSTPIPESPSDEDDSNYDEAAPDALTDTQNSRQALPEKHIVPPHICFRSKNHCHVYIENGPVISLEDVKTRPSTANDSNMFGDNWCKYPLDSFYCNIPADQTTWMRIVKNSQQCVPMVECKVLQPHEDKSILAYSSCYVKKPLYSYVTLRLLAELFPVTIHVLLNVATIVATRETSIGRGNVGHQFAFNAIGVLVFSTLLGCINHVVNVAVYVVPIITFSIAFLVAAVAVLLSTNLPLTPSDWWWHTKCGMLAIPMSALKRYKWVISTIGLVTLVLGVFGHCQEAYRHLYHIDLIEDSLITDSVIRSKTFVYVFGSFMAIPILWNGEKIIDCLGHSNILILAFVSYVLRFAGLTFDQTPWSSLFELLEPISYYLAWITLVLFLRHLVPKKLLATGQAFLVIFYYSIGRAIGFFYGVTTTLPDKNNIQLIDIYQIMATISCAIAVIYFIVYHCILLPKYRGRVPINALNSSNDMNVSPQRVYHDERSRKGYFRY